MIQICGTEAFERLLNTIFYNHLLENGVDEKHIIRFAFDSADDLYLIGENLISVPMFM